MARGGKREGSGRPAVPENEKASTTGVSMTPTTRARLERIARERGLLWGGKPSLAKVIETLALEECERLDKYAYAALK